MPKIERQTMRPVVVKDEAGDAWDYADKFSMMVYGVSGTGKTTFWSSFPGPVLALICGKRSEEMRSIDTPENRKKIKPMMCSTGEHIEKCLELAAKGDYETVVLDHGTSLRQVLLREELGVEQLLQNRWGLATRDNYYAVALKMKEILTRFLDLQAYRVIVAQEKDHNEDEEGGIEKSELLDDMQVASYGGDFSASVIRWLNPECSYIVQTFKRPKMVRVEKEVKLAGKVKKVWETERAIGKGGKGEVEYCLRVAPHDIAITKFRMWKDGTKELPGAIVDPTFAKVMAVIRGEKAS